MLPEVMVTNWTLTSDHCVVYWAYMTHAQGQCVCDVMDQVIVIYFGLRVPSVVPRVCSGPSVPVL